MPKDNKLEYLAGQVSGLMAFVGASINSHPDIALLAQEYQRLSEAQFSAVLAAKISEDFLEGQ